MNFSRVNVTNSSNVIDGLDPWVESGALVYVALTVATFSAVMMCCTWFFKENWTKSTLYGRLDVDEETIELQSSQLSEESDEEIPLGIESPARVESPNPSNEVFTLEHGPSSSEENDSCDENEREEHELLDESVTTV